MIRSLGVTKDKELINDLSLMELNNSNIKWYWVDFDSPNEDEINELRSSFNFHTLSIEDCLHFLQRPKADYYDDYSFFVLHSLNQKTLEAEELDVFIGDNYIVTFHSSHLYEVDSVWERVTCEKGILSKNHTYVTYLIMNKIVTEYFPAVYKIEDVLNNLDSFAKYQSLRNLMNKIFDIRSDLLKLRRLINSMRDLLYTILNTTDFEGFKYSKLHFTDVYDHLLRLSEMIEANRDITADIRDSYLSISSDRMNRIMMVFTVVTSIFIPLTFITGIYGMNFEYIPELKWRFGYFMVLSVMALISVSMFFWFKHKGWFND
ncbi:magnesium/cobalt transporter CorA [Wukongibacter sp. M2B1]|uniref:magnesium/cobalt transporter CorA n=1 Tax=Wukongibacter sp. M2B1 TaxID=3088895 RepID=UPI003D7980A8